MSRCRNCGGSGWICRSNSGSHPRLKPPFKKATQAYVEWRPCYSCANKTVTAQPSSNTSHPLAYEHTPLPSTFTELAFELEPEYREPE